MDGILKSFYLRIIKTYTIEQDGKEMGRFTETELGNFLDGRDVGVTSNGVMYRTDKDGLLSTT